MSKKRLDAEGHDRTMVTKAEGGDSSEAKNLSDVSRPGFQQGRKEPVCWPSGSLRSCFRTHNERSGFLVGQALLPANGQTGMSAPPF